MNLRIFLRANTMALTLAFAQFAMSQSPQGIVKTLTDEVGTPQYIKFNVSETQFQQSSTNAQTLLKNSLSLTSDDEFRLKTTLNDQIGFVHDKYQQYYKGIKVEDGVYSLHAKNGIVHAISGSYLRNTSIPTTPAISADEALNTAISYVGAKKYLWDNVQLANLFEYQKPQGELVILNRQLAYKFDIYALKPISRAYIYVDAINNRVIEKRDRLHSDVAIGLADTRYSGRQTITTDSYNGSYRLRDYSRGSGIETYNMRMGIDYATAVDFTDNDNTWTAAEFNNAAKDNAALDAHFGAEKTYDFFKLKFNRLSYDNANSKLKNYVHFNLVEYGYPDNDNAFWDGSEMTYGDGTSWPPLTTLDITAHEIGHGVCEHSAGLVYQSEPGAMNESLSDIWGACVEYYAAPTKKRWQMGDDLGTPIRYMDTPKLAGNPDTYKGQYWYFSSGDNGGVHYNSGVMNHWFYILSDGLTGTNDWGYSFAINGLGIDKAAQITYRLESVYLSSGSAYKDARKFSVIAAEDIYGAGSTEAKTVKTAWDAVGVDSIFPSYCQVAAISGQAPGYISTVKLGNKSVQSQWAKYSKFINANMAIMPNTRDSITILTTSTNAPVYFKVWIDFNGDKVFDDASEMLINQTVNQGASLGKGFVVPASAHNGPTAMRIIMSKNSIVSACENLSLGEVEDYLVNIGRQIVDSIPPTVPTSLTASNISNRSIRLRWKKSTDNNGVVVYDVYQNNTFLKSVTDTTVVIDGLTCETRYQFTVLAKDAAGNKSALSSPIIVTTGTCTHLPPTITITSPVTGATFRLGETISISGVSADSDGSIQKVTAFANGTIVGTTTNANYNILWKPTAAGPYKLVVVATDNENMTASTDTIRINVIYVACTFGTPLATALPSTNYARYTHVYVLGNNAPNLTNVTEFVINWDLTQKGLWQFSMQTNNGKPDWWNDLRTKMTQTFASPKPSLTFTNTGFPGLDGSYYVATYQGDFVMVEITRGCVVYCTNSAIAPVCTALKSVLSNVENSVNDKLVIYPSPFSNELYINTTLLKDNIKTIELISSTGRVVKKINGSELQNGIININPGMAAGYYIVKVVTSNGVYTTRIIKE